MHTVQAGMEFLPVGHGSTRVIFDESEFQKYKLYQTEILHFVHSLVKKSQTSVLFCFFLFFLNDLRWNYPKFLVKILREKHFCLETFFVIEYFRFQIIFYVKTATPLKNVTPLKIQTLSTPIFENLAKGSHYEIFLGHFCLQKTSVILNLV